MSVFKNIIFDLGGVFIDINYAATRNAFIDLGIKNFDELYQQDFVSTLFEDLEVGKISEKDFYDEFRIISNSNLKNNEIEKSWNAMLGKFWIERLEFVSSLKAHFNVFLLSNTNEIHQKCFEKMFEDEFPTKNLLNYFNQVYYSHEMGLRKPNADCYLKIIEEHHLKASETLFIDDTYKNIEGALRVELQILHLKPQTNLVESVTQILNFPNK